MIEKVISDNKEREYLVEILYVVIVILCRGYLRLLLL